MATLEEKTRDFLDALDEIEYQHTTHFTLEAPKTDGDINDKLANYYRFQINNGVVYFGFITKSGLSRKIRKQSWAKFEHFFPEGIIVGSVMEK